MVGSVLPWRVQIIEHFQSVQKVWLGSVGKDSPEPMKCFIEKSDLGLRFTPGTLEDTLKDKTEMGAPLDEMSNGLCFHSGGAKDKSNT